MPVPTAITDLSQTAASNSPAGSESPITTDNYLRQLAAFIAQLYDFTVNFVVNKNSTATASLPTANTNSVGRFVGANSANPRMFVESFAGSPGVAGRRANGTAAIPTAVQSGQVIAEFAGYGYGATAYQANSGGGFQLVAAENWTDSAMGTYGVINLTPIGSTSSANIVRWADTGEMGCRVIPTAGINASIQTKDGIKFPATQVASTDPNVLDDYEEGTWTPTLGSWSNSGSPTLAGRYTKIGRQVTLHLTVTPATSVSATAGSSTVSGWAGIGAAAANAVGSVANCTNGTPIGQAMIVAGNSNLFMPTTGTVGSPGSVDVTITYSV